MNNFDTQRGYFLGRYSDSLFIGGLSFLYLALTIFISIKVETVTLAVIYLAWFINWPHFSATYWRVYRNSHYVKEFPITLIWIPLIIIVLGGLCFVFKDTLPPLWARIYTIWSPFHYSAQTFGITMLYLIRCNYQFTQVDRYLFYFFALVSFFMALFIGESGGGKQFYFNISYNSLEVPQFLITISYIALAICFIGLVARHFYSIKYYRQTRSWIIYLPILTQFTWFIPGYFNRNFYELVPLFHSLQYLFLIFIFDCFKEKGGESFTLSKGLRWYFINIAGGAILFWLLPEVASGLGLEILLATAIIHILVQFLHFLYDGVIWKADAGNLLKEVRI